MRRFFTSESVTEGHPDKIADQISDAILDDVLAHDPEARVACETICTTGLVMVFGEMTTNHYVDLQKIVRKTVADIGYTRGKFGFDADNLSVLSAIDPQSPDIALGFNSSYAVASHWCVTLPLSPETPLPQSLPPLLARAGPPWSPRSG